LINTCLFVLGEEIVMVLALGSLTSGPLGSHAAGFAEELSRQGYTVNGGEQHLRFIAERRKFPILTGETLDIFG